MLLRLIPYRSSPTFAGSFTVLVPEVGAEGRVYLDDQKHEFNHKSVASSHDGSKLIKVSPTEAAKVERCFGWQNLDVKLFVKLEVAVVCKEEMPVDIKIRLVGPYGG